METLYTHNQTKLEIIAIRKQSKLSNKIQINKLYVLFWMNYGSVLTHVK